MSKVLPINNIQKTVAKKIVSSLDTSPTQILAWYTGSGKTNIFLYMCRMLIKENPKIKIGISCYLHRNIKNQTSERADIFLPEHSVIHSVRSNNDIVYEVEKNVFLFNPQTLYKRKEMPFKFDVLFLDEGHVGFNMWKGSDKLFGHLLKHHCKPNCKIIPVTATPWVILGNPLFKDVQIHKRTMAEGYYKDKMIHDFNINIERFDIKTRKTDFSRGGDLTTRYLRKSFDVLKRLCLEKTAKIIAENKDKLGGKCLVIVPPGNNCEIAQLVAQQIGNSASYLIGGNTIFSHEEGDKLSKQEDKAIREFKENPKKKFLVVVHKCQVGFDMLSLTSTIDLTMTRNIALLIQRWGRLGRHFEKYKHSVKNYFYCIDDSMLPEESEWILGTSIDFSLGNWDNFTRNRDIKHRKTRIYGLSGGKKEFSTSFSQLLIHYQGLSHVKHKTISFSKETVATNSWSKDALIAKAKEYKSRTEISRYNAYVYRMLKKHYKEDLDAIFPYKTKSWTIESALEEMKKYKTRKEFRKKAPGALSLIEDKKINHALHKRFGPNFDKKVTIEDARKLAPKFILRSEFKKAHSTAYFLLKKEDPKFFNETFPYKYNNKRRLKSISS